MDGQVRRSVHASNPPTHPLQQVPEEDYTIPLGQAEVMRPGTDVTVVGWGGQLRVLEKVRGKEDPPTYQPHTNRRVI